MSKTDQTWYDAKTRLAEVAIPLISTLRRCRHGYPAALYEEMGSGDLADARWEEILKEIQEALITVRDNTDLLEDELEDQQKGLELFGKWFKHLWD